MRIHLIDVREQKKQDYEFHRGTVSIGSDGTNLVQLPSISIPSFVAMLVPEPTSQGEAWKLVPMEHELELLINDRPAKEACHLKDGDELAIENFLLKIAFDVTPRSEGLSEDAAAGVNLSRITQFPLPPGSEVHRPELAYSLAPERMDELSRLSAELGSLGDVARIMEAVAGFTHEALGSRLTWLGLRKKPDGPLDLRDIRIRDQKTPDEPPLLATFEHRCLERRQQIRIVKPFALEVGSAMALPVLTPNAAFGLLYVDRGEQERVFNVADFDFAGALAVIIGHQWERVIQTQTHMKGAVQEAQLTLLRAAQMRLDPTQIPEWPSLQFSVYSRAGTLSGGDLYDFSRLPNGLASILLLRSMAPPDTAALILSELRSAFRIAGMHADPPHIQLKAMNWLLHHASGKDPVHAAIFAINPTTGAFEYSTAGEIGALAINETGDPRVLTVFDAPALGQGPKSVYERKQERLNPQETLALFTPGCTKAMDSKGSLLTRGMLMDSLCDGFGESASAAMEDLLRDLDPYVKNGHLPEDVTVLLLHRPLPAKVPISPLTP